MKRVVCSFVVVFAAWTASAQIEKGTWLVGANSNLGYNSYTPTSGGSNQSYFNIGVRSGYFVGENFLVGANLEYLNASSSGPSSSVTTIGLFTRYYISKVFLGAGYNSLSQSGFYSNGTSWGSIPIELGFVGFITRNIAVEPAFVYTIATDTDKGGMPGYAGLPFPAKSGFGIRIGFSLYLGRPAASE